MIEAAMARKGLTQQRLAEETGLTAPWVNMILRQGKMPGCEALLRIADALGVDRTRLVRRAHLERAYDEWRPYLEGTGEDGEDGGPDGLERGRRFSIPVIGTAAAGEGGSEVELGRPEEPNGSARAADEPARYAVLPPEIGFHPECRAIVVRGESLEPVAYDGQYVVISPAVRKEEIPDGSIVYVTYELPEEPAPRAMVKRVYRNRIQGEEGEPQGLPVYSFVPVNTHLRKKGRAPEPQEAITLRHRQVREMYPVVGVVF
jgi:transcriptional regulator with XRE-family HTH domain